MLKANTLFLIAIQFLGGIQSVNVLAQSNNIYPAITGRPFTYTTQIGDSLTRISARFGVSEQTLRLQNKLSGNVRLKQGQTLFVDNRHIAPLPIKEGIIINLPQRMLFYFHNFELISAYPVAVGKPATPTPTGEFRVANKEVDKTWEVPKSIQEEMRRAGKPVKVRVPPGPDNPLGKFWMGLSIPGYGIHGTNAPASIYRFQTHGCIRLHPDDIAELYQRVSLNTPVKIVYEPLLLTKHNEAIFLESHKDIYNKNVKFMERIKGKARDLNVAELIDWDVSEVIMSKHTGVAEEIPSSAANNLVDKYEKVKSENNIHDRPVILKSGCLPGRGNLAGLG